MKQHIELPSKESSELTPKDKLIYLALKSYENGKTHDCFPSMAKISERCGASEPTIKKSLDKLEKEGYITIEKVNPRKKRYKFSEYKKFECFSYEFLYNKDLTFTEKSYLAASQQFMIEKESGRGRIDYSSYELSNKINMSPTTIRRCDKSLVEKEYMTIIRKTKNGLKTSEIDSRYYDFTKYNEAVCDAIISHEDRITSLEEKFALQEKREKEKDAYIAKLESQLREKQIEESKIII